MDASNAAIALYTDAIKRNPNDAQAYVNRGDAYASVQVDTFYQNAWNDYSTAIKLDPKCAAAYYGRAYAAYWGRISHDGSIGHPEYTATEKYDGVVRDASRAIELAGNLGDAYRLRGEALQNQDATRAIGDFYMATFLNPKDREAFDNLGSLYLQRWRSTGDKSYYDKAIAADSEVIRLAPDSMYSYEMRVILYVENHDYEHTISDCTEMLKYGGADYALGTRGNAYFALGQYDKAAADFQGMGMYGNVPGSSMSLAEAYYANGQMKEALDSFRESAKFAIGAGPGGLPEDQGYSLRPSFYLWLIEVEQIHQTDAANKELEEAIQLYSRHAMPDCLPQIGDYLLGHLPENQFLKLVDALDPKKAQDQKSEALFFAGMKHLFAGDAAGAKRFFQQAVDLGEKSEPGYQFARVRLANLASPSAPPVAAIVDELTHQPTDAEKAAAKGHIQQGLVYEKDGNTPAAFGEFDDAIGSDPGNAEAFYHRGLDREPDGDHVGAIADFTRAVELDPKFRDAYDQRLLMRVETKDFDGAVADGDQVVALDSKNPDSYDHRGEARTCKNDFAGAIADFKQAVALDPKLVEAYNDLGYAEYCAGDLAAALADQNKALALDPTNVEAFFNRGEIHDAQGDLDAGIADYNRALQSPGYSTPYFPRAVDEMAQGHLKQALDDLTQYLGAGAGAEEGDYARMLVWIILQEDKQGRNADVELSEQLDKKDAEPGNWQAAPDDWVTKDAAFLLGRLSERDYLAAAASPDARTDQGQHCEAWFYSGMKHLLAGDKLGAIARFKKCVATNRSDYVEFTLAKGQLKALEATK